MKTCFVWPRRHLDFNPYEKYPCPKLTPVQNLIGCLCFSAPGRQQIQQKIFSQVFESFCWFLLQHHIKQAAYIQYKGPQSLVSEKKEFSLYTCVHVYILFLFPSQDQPTLGGSITQLLNESLHVFSAIRNIHKILWCLNCRSGLICCNAKSGRAAQVLRVVKPLSTSLVRGFIMGWFAEPFCYFVFI